MPWLALLEFRPVSGGPEVEPVKRLVPLTVFVWPRLKFAPTPEPARAEVVVRRVAASAPGEHVQKRLQVSGRGGSFLHLDLDAFVATATANA